MQNILISAEYYNLFYIVMCEWNIGYVCIVRYSVVAGTDNI